MPYRYKNKNRIQEIIKNRRGPDNRFVSNWGHYRTGPVICELLEKNKTDLFVDVGACGCQLSEIVLIEFPNIQVTAVDITFGIHSNRAGGLILAPLDRIKKEWPNRFKAIEAPSLEAVEAFEDESIGLVYIDAKHIYDMVKADILAWWPKVKIGGILAGHDYKHNSNPGVQKAVDELLGSVRVEDYFNWWARKNQKRLVKATI